MSKECFCDDSAWGISTAFGYWAFLQRGLWKCLRQLMRLFSLKERITAHASSFPNHMRVWQPDVFGFAGCFFTGRVKYVSVSRLHFLLIDLRRVEQEADSNLHVCLCNCRQRRARSVGPQYSWWCWVSMLRSQRRCRLQTSIWLYRPRDTPTSHYIWFYLSAPDWI